MPYRISGKDPQNFGIDIIRTRRKPYGSDFSLGYKILCDLQQGTHESSVDPGKRTAEKSNFRFAPLGNGGQRRSDRIPDIGQRKSVATGNGILITEYTPIGTPHMRNKDRNVVMRHAPYSSIPNKCSASCAASCSACFLECPTPLPIRLESKYNSTVNVLS